MIQTVNGEGVGAGKSYLAVHLVAEKIADGGTVCFLETFQPKFEGIIKACQVDFGVVPVPEQLVLIKKEDAHRIHEVTPAGTEGNTVLIVADEIHEFFDSRDSVKADKMKNDFLLWLTQSRHDDTDLLFITQHTKNMDVKIRRMATFEWYCRDMGQWTIPGLGRYKTLIRLVSFGMMSGDYIRASKYSQDGKTLMERRKLPRRKLYFDCYESKSMRGKRKRAGSPLAKFQLKRVAKGDEKNMIRFILIAMGIVLVFCGYKVFTNTREGKIPFREMQSPIALKGVAPQPVPEKQTIPQPGVTAVASTGGVLSSFREGLKSDKWDIFPEPFLASVGDAILVTAVDEYDAGSMSRHGFIKSVKGRVAECIEPSGRLGYIVGENALAVPLGAVASAKKQPEDKIKQADKYTDILSRGQAVAEGLLPPGDTDDVADHNIRMAQQHRTVSNLPPVGQAYSPPAGAQVGVPVGNPVR